MPDQMVDETPVIIEQESDKTVTPDDAGETVVSEPAAEDETWQSETGSEPELAQEQAQTKLEAQQVILEEQQNLTLDALATRLDDQMRQFRETHEVAINAQTAAITRLAEALESKNSTPPTSSDLTTPTSESKVESRGEKRRRLSRERRANRQK